MFNSTFYNISVISNIVIFNFIVGGNRTTYIEENYVLLSPGRLEDNKSVVSNRKPKKHNSKNKSGIGQTMIYKTQNRKLTIEKHELHKNPGWTQVLWKSWQFLLRSWHTSYNWQTVLHKVVSSTKWTFLDYICSIMFLFLVGLYLWMNLIHPPPPRTSNNVLHSKLVLIPDTKSQYWIYFHMNKRLLYI